MKPRILAAIAALCCCVGCEPQKQVNVNPTHVTNVMETEPVQRADRMVDALHNRAHVAFEEGVLRGFMVKREHPEYGISNILQTAWDVSTTKQFNETDK